MRTITFQILVILLLTLSVAAQKEAQKPILIDEFEKITNEDRFSRLDNLLAQLRKTPDAKGVIRIYGGNDDCFLCRYGLGSWMRALATNTRQFPSEEISVEFCDEKRSNLRTQLFLVPVDSNLEGCIETIETPKSSAEFDSVSFYFRDNELSPIEDLVIDVVSPSNGEYSRTVCEKVNNLLDKSPESKIYVIVYLGTNRETKFGNSGDKIVRKLDNKSLANKMLQIAKRELLKNDYEAAKIELVDGGYIDNRRKLEFWFVPKDGEIPKPQPDYFLKKKR